MAQAVTRSTIILFGVLSLMSWHPGTAADEPRPECQHAADRLINSGWEHYRRNDLPAARRDFTAAHVLCRSRSGAVVGLAYVALRTGSIDEARTQFDQVLRLSDSDVDAIVGRALVAQREGDRKLALELFQRALRLAPDHEGARVERDSLLPPKPPERPQLVLPATVIPTARTGRKTLQIRSGDSWIPFYVNGVNLGAALPGKHPSEFPAREVYEKWLDQIAGMGANTIRVYTIHPPQFYDALYEWNSSHEQSPLRLIHGVWAELPEDNDFAGSDWQDEFRNEMAQVVDIIHGRADIEPRPGHAGGSYISDVSPWVIGYILGREWEPNAVTRFNRLRPDEDSFRGEYLQIDHGTPMDAWLIRSCDWIITYETRKYRVQRPVAYTNWPTLDPLRHPTEATLEEEYEIRRSRGERLHRDLSEFSEDAAHLDAMLVRSTPAFQAGFFASFHVYPYYPDFINLDPTYNDASSSQGRSNFFGYLKELKEHHAGMPLLISEYGVPASIGASHLQPQGWHHGGLTEDRMAEINARMTLEIAEAGMAGGVVFAWIDEWFKKNWMVMDFEIPPERNRLWHNRLDPEQHYGMLALEAAAAVAGETFDSRRGAWNQITPLYADEHGTLRASADEAYLWVHLELKQPADGDLFIGFDTINPKGGSFRWPGSAGPPIPVGIEFVLHVSTTKAQLLADPNANPISIVPLPDIPGDPLEMDVTDPPPGFFQGRFDQRFNRPYLSLPRDDGNFETLRVRTNARRFGRDGTEYAAMGYDRGILPEGEPPDGLWQWDAERKSLEVRIPWMLLNFSDPSHRRVLDDSASSRLTPFIGTTIVDGIRIVAAHAGSTQWTHWPAMRGPQPVPNFVWPEWETPTWRERKRPTYDSVHEAFERLNQMQLEVTP